MINSVTLVGRAGKDPEVRNFQSGSKVAKLRMACNRPTKEQQTDWFDIEIWGNQADIAAQYIKKGHLFGIIGRAEVESWEKDGQQHSRVKFVANQVRLMQPKDDNEAPGGGLPAQAQNQQQAGGAQQDVFAAFNQPQQLPF